MEVSSFLDSKESENNNEKLLKSTIKSKFHRVIAMKVVNSEPESETIVNYVLKGYNDYTKHKALMKNNEILFENYFKNKDEDLIKSFEHFNDDVQKSILYNNANKLKKRILSNKYNNLCNEETDKLFLQMANMDFSRDELQQFIGKKLSAFHYPEELNGALMNLIEIKADWSPEEILHKLSVHCEEDKDYSVGYNKDNKLIIDILTFEASKNVGSKMWCITREEEMYKHYKKNQHIDYKYLFDFSKKTSDDLSMVAILTNLDGNIDELYSKDDTELSKDVDTRKIYENLIKDIYSESYNLFQQIEKLQNNAELEYNPLYNNKFDPNDEDHHYILLNGISSYDTVISKEDMNKHPKLFNTENMTKDDFDFMRDIDIKDYLSDGLQYSDEMIGFLRKKNFSDNTLNFLLKDEETKTVFAKSLTGFSAYLLEEKRYGILLDFIQDPLVIKKIGLCARFGMAESNNIFLNMAKDDEFLKYLRENKKVNIISEVFNASKNEVINANVTNEDDKKLDMNVYIDSGLIKIRKKEELDNIKEILPEINSYYSDFSRFDYMKNLYFGRLDTIPSEVLKHFDFEKEKDNVVKSLGNKLLKDLIPNTYNHPKKDFDKYVNNFKTTFDFLETLDENTKKVDDNLFMGSYSNRSVFNKNISECDLMDSFDNLYVYELESKKENAQKAFFDILIDLSKKMELKGGINVGQIINRHIIHENYVKLEKRELTKEYKIGFRIFIEKLNDNELINKDSLKRVSKEDQEKSIIFDIAKKAINHSEMKRLLQRK